MQCEEWADANSELFKEAHDETVHKNSYKRKLYELISASLIYSSLKRGTKSMKAVHRRVIRITVRRESTVPYRIWAEAERP